MLATTNDKGDVHLSGESASGFIGALQFGLENNVDEVAFELHDPLQFFINSLVNDVGVGGELEFKNFIAKGDYKGGVGYLLKFYGENGNPIMATMSSAYEKGGDGLFEIAVFDPDNPGKGTLKSDFFMEFVKVDMDVKPLNIFVINKKLIDDFMNGKSLVYDFNYIVRTAFHEAVHFSQENKKNGLWNSANLDFIEIQANYLTFNVSKEKLPEYSVKSRVGFAKYILNVYFAKVEKAINLTPIEVALLPIYKEYFKKITKSKK